MTTLEVITFDVDYCKSEKTSRSDVYNSTRINIKVQNWLNTILIYSKAEGKEFPIDTDTPTMVNYIIKLIS